MQFHVDALSTERNTLHLQQHSLFRPSLRQLDFALRPKNPLPRQSTCAIRQEPGNGPVCLRVSSESSNFPVGGYPPFWNPKYDPADCGCEIATHSFRSFTAFSRSILRVAAAFGLSRFTAANCWLPLHLSP